MKALLTFVGLLACVGSTLAAKPFLCYWEFWGIYRSAPHSGTIDKIPANLCTHVIYSFVGLDDQAMKVKPLDTKLDSDLRGLVALKKQNPALKVMVAIGGWGEGAAKYSKMAGQSGYRKSFVASVVELVNKYNLDGFDVDWEFPGATDRGGSPADKANLISLLQELRSALGRKLLTIAVAGPQYRIDAGYDVPNLAKAVDYINVMAYDLRGAWDGVTGNHVGLYGNGISVSQVMQAWANSGAPKNKLIMGIAFYGKSFTLESPSNTGLGARGSAGQAGEVSKEGGSLYYFEICKRINEGWKRVFDSDTKSPYAYGGGNQWVGYEDVEGIKHKTDLIQKEGYAGAMAWAIELDDQTGVCNQGKFPLANAVVKGLGGSSGGRGRDKRSLDNRRGIDMAQLRKTNGMKYKRSLDNRRGIDMAQLRRTNGMKYRRSLDNRRGIDMAQLRKTNGMKYKRSLDNRRGIDMAQLRRTNGMKYRRSLDNRRGIDMAQLRRTNGMKYKRGLDSKNDE